jgi:prolipoprotein diacylglyceryltransferase
MTLPDVVVLHFEPWFRVGDIVVRWQAAELAAVILVALLAWVAQLRAVEGSGLRLDDAAFVLLGAVPGAVVGGRVFHGLAYLDAYAASPAQLMDVSRGSLSLVGAVLCGALTALYVCRLLGHPVGRWTDAAAIPLLVAIGLGKLAMVLGGAGQGARFDGPLALAFDGSGPWWSEDASTPSYPSQVYEGLWALAGIVIVWLVARRLRGSRNASNGRVLLAGIAWWLAGRALIAVTWRDEPVVGPLGAEALLTIGALGLVVLTGLAAIRQIAR